MKKVIVLLMALLVVFGIVFAESQNVYDGMFDDLADTVTISKEEYELLKKAAESSENQSGGLLKNLFNKETVVISKDEYESYQKYDKIEEIYQYLKEYYYIEPDYDKMMEYAISGMMTALDDPYSFYYNKEAWTELWEDDEGEYAGVGLQLLGNYQTNIVTVSRVFKGTPAENVGIRKGDILKRVDDLQVDAYSMEDAVNIMRGYLDQLVEIEVERRGERLVFSVPRAQIKINWIETTMLENNVGYICLYEFSGDCSERFHEAVNDLENQGATSLIIDLRDNGGGWVSDALAIADIFLDKTLLFYSEDRSGAREENYTKEGADNIPLIFMVNEGSASSSEILSGSMQDLGRAKIVGTQSYGKGIIQYVLPLTGNDDGFQFTCAQYFLPSGKAVHKIGITPDVIVEMPEDFVGEYFQLGDMTDPQLKCAWEEAVKLRDETK